MLKSKKSPINLSHLSLVNLFDRGTPELKIFTMAICLVLFGISFSFLKIMAVIGFMILGFMFIPFIVWLYLNLK